MQPSNADKRFLVPAATFCVELSSCKLVVHGCEQGKPDPKRAPQSSTRHVSVKAKLPLTCCSKTPLIAHWNFVHADRVRLKKTHCLPWAPAQTECCRPTLALHNLQVNFDSCCLAQSAKSPDPIHVFFCKTPCATLDLAKSALCFLRQETS